MFHLADFLLKHPFVLKPHSRILIACSAGPDSVALVHALKDLEHSWQLNIHVAHVNHALRGRDSEKDELFVRKLCAKLNLPCHVEHRSVRSLRSGNLEEVAREKRYEALFSIANKYKCSALFTAHTLEDQVETVLMNIIRGSGIDGLAGIEPIRFLPEKKIWLCRPLLETSKTELLEVLTSSKWQFRSDKSNHNKKFLRNWLRLDLIPQIEARCPGFKKRLRNLAELAGEEKRHWAVTIDEVQKDLLKPYRGGQLLDLGGLLRYSPAVQRRFFRRSLGQNLMTFETVERLRDWMQSPPSSGRLWQLRKGWVVERLSKSKGSPSSRLFWFRQSKQKKEKNRT